jgi:uncharacterized Zn finger protein (UPF0148 family)
MNEITSTQASSCPKCGAPRHHKGAFCPNCGTHLLPQPDDAASTFHTHTQASTDIQAKLDPEQMWWEGFDTSAEAKRLELEDRYEESEELMDRAISLWTEALRLGVQGKSEISCHWFLGNEFYDRAVDLDEHHKLSTLPLDQIPTLSKGVFHLEKALELDAALGNFIFGDKLNQADLLKLDMVWGAQALYTKNKYGTEAAISYIVEKIKLTQHLLVVLPNLFYSFGYVYAEANSVANALDMFRAAINAEDYGDVIDHEDWRYRVAQIAKANASKNLKYLEIQGRVPSADQRNANELYEQALAAGDAQEYEKGIRLLDACLCLKPEALIEMTGFFNLFVMIQLKHGFADRHGDSVPDDEFRWFCRMVLCVKKAIQVYETGLADRLSGDTLEEVTAIYNQAKHFEKTNGITYGITCRDASGNLTWRDFKKVYAANSFPLACIEKEERAEAEKAFRN